MAPPRGPDCNQNDPSRLPSPTLPAAVSPSLSVLHSPKQEPSRSDTEAIDPQAAEFVRTDPSEEERSPTVDDSDGLWRRRAEIPLGVAPSESGEQPQQDERVESPQSKHGDLGPRTASPETHEEDGSKTAPVEGSNGAQQRQDSGAGSPSRQGSISLWPLPDPLNLLGRTRAQSMPHIGSRKNSRQDTQDSRAENGEAHTPATQRWTVLKQRLQAGGLSLLKEKRQTLVAQASMTAQVDLNEELMAGPLAPLILGMWFERDENGMRRMPVLLQHLKIRVSDSIHPLRATHAVFRIECEYGDDAARWVIYRELRDFLSLHTHYSISYTDLSMPEFPRTGIPLLNILKKEAGENGNPADRAEFARQQRGALENYLICLIKAVVFRPAANRLCRFLEISALSVVLACSGGTQGKAGFLRVLSSTSTHKGPRPIEFLSWKRPQTLTWWLVRESYLVSVADPAELAIDDVFMLDADFSIERPKRVFRQGLNLLHISGGEKESTMNERDLMKRQEKGKEKEQDHNGGETEKGGTEVIKSRSTIGKLFSSSSTSKGKPIGDAQPPKEEPDRRSSSAVESAPSSSSSSLSESLSDTNLQIGIKPSIGKDPRTVGSKEEEEVVAVNGANSKKKEPATDVSQHTFYLKNRQRKLMFVAKNERQMLQFIASIERMAAQSVWTGTNQFESFAPIRLNVNAQWLVDGRDYFWNLSRAISLAKERIYIHNWWLSPELYLRRPAQEHYRLDRMLKRKAEQGVKIYVILYKEASNRTTPIDSNYAKQTLMGLHPNIMVQRSPTHTPTSTFYWAHNDKMCVVDETVAFMGGLDLCFGRWDTSQHVLVNNGDIEEIIWPGKDYSNARVLDFHTLNHPEQDMYDRTKVARMPWHDVGIQFVGQPARDLCRHFVQRWNHLLRTKTHSRVMPFLLPAPDFKITELNDQGLTGTCEIQICRSAGPRSLGTASHIERSIQNAYLKSIELSEHFIYIENPFFITSTVVNDIIVENHIGDALVHRISRAHRENTPWRACIVIPLLPGFTLPIDHNDANSIRVIVELQNRSICRGPHSIFSRLRNEGIEPNDYISFFSLRNWGKLENNTLSTEQVYVHSKIMIVDDRVAIIGSANINERSMCGDRDSELACVVRDTDMIQGQMAGRPFKVGRFAHTLRIRLMREHVGIDTDATYEEHLMAAEAEVQPEDVNPLAKENNRPPSARPGQGEFSDEECWPAAARRQLRKHSPVKTEATPHTLPTREPGVDPHGFGDPLDPRFWSDFWCATAVHNTEIYRKVFHCTPDDFVTTWRMYKEYRLFQERLNKPPKDRMDVPWTPSQRGSTGHKIGHDGRPRRQTNRNEPLEQWERDELEALLEGVKGHLVVFPTRFLEEEDTANNFLHNSDKLLPMPVFN